MLKYELSAIWVVYNLKLLALSVEALSVKDLSCQPTIWVLTVWVSNIWVVNNLRCQWSEYDLSVKALTVDNLSCRRSEMLMIWVVKDLCFRRFDLPIISVVLMIWAVDNLICLNYLSVKALSVEALSCQWSELSMMFKTFKNGDNRNRDRTLLLMSFLAEPLDQESIL